MTPKSRFVAFTYMWQSVNRRVYQQNAIEGYISKMQMQTSNFMQQHSELQRRNL